MYHLAVFSFLNRKGAKLFSLRGKGNLLQQVELVLK